MGPKHGKRDGGGYITAAAATITKPLVCFHVPLPSWIPSAKVIDCNKKFFVYLASKQKRELTVSSDINKAMFSKVSIWQIYNIKKDKKSTSNLKCSISTWVLLSKSNCFH